MSWSGAFESPALSKSNNENYKIVNSEILNKFKVSHKKHNFICHFVGEGSNSESIKSYIENLTNYNEKILIKDIDVLAPFKGNDTKLNVKVFKQNELYSLKYLWDYSDTGLEYLSHSFQIVEKDKKMQIDFDSSISGTFEFYNMENKIINHSYNFFGECEWKQII